MMSIIIMMMMMLLTIGRCSTVRSRRRRTIVWIAAAIAIAISISAHMIHLLPTPIIPTIRIRRSRSSSIPIQTQMKLQRILHEPLQFPLKNLVVLPRPVRVISHERHHDKVGIPSLLLPSGAVLGNDPELAAAHDVGRGRGGIGLRVVRTVTSFLESVPIAQRPQNVHAGVDGADLIETSHGRVDQVPLGRFVDLDVERQIVLGVLFELFVVEV